MDNVVLFMKLREDLKEDLEKAMAAHSTLISARLDQKIDEKLSPIREDIIYIKNHNERQNGWVEEHNKRLDAIDNLKNGTVAAVNKRLDIIQQTYKIAGVLSGKNWKRNIILVIIGWYIINSLFDMVSIPQVIEFVKLIK